METGKIRVVRLKKSELQEGQIVYWNGCPSKVKVWVLLQKQGKDSWNLTPYTQRLNPVRAQTAYSRELKTLHVIYERYEQTYPRSGRDFQGNEKYDFVKHTFPLNIENWNEVIKNNLIDKKILFKILEIHSGLIKINQEQVKFTFEQLLKYQTENCFNAVDFQSNGAKEKIEEWVKQKT